SITPYRLEVSGQQAILGSTIQRELEFSIITQLKYLVEPLGFEPRPDGLKVRCLNRLTIAPSF
ncbi:MAG: hypothetical protein RLZZ382_2214, partial [Bacteroidota bacterium]